MSASCSIRRNVCSSSRRDFVVIRPLSGRRPEYYFFRRIYISSDLSVLGMSQAHPIEKPQTPLQCFPSAWKYMGM
jgi:hypothetical protein